MDEGGRASGERLLVDLSSAAAAPSAPDLLEVLETHISRLFLTTHRVYKVKKPLTLGFLDYSTLEKRRHFCHEEVRLNRRLAPRTYLGVAPLTVDAEGRWRVAGDGTPREWAVEMRRLPAAGMLDHRLRGGAIDNAMLEQIAGRLVSFHREAQCGPEVRRYGEPDAVAELIEDNLEELHDLVAADGPLPAPLLGFLADRALSFLARSRELLARRAQEGRIREGHGDLHAGNLCLADGAWVIYDCIEFSRRFRCGDQALDLAFLAMDLDHRGFHAFSAYLVRRYAKLAGDSELPRLMPFYKAYRAAVRGKVACLRAADADADVAAAARREAAAYLQLAAHYDLGPALILTCGLPATGKSWAARALVERWNAAWLRSDVRRKSLAGLPPTGRGAAGKRAGLYSEEMSQRTYDSLLERAERALGEDRTVVVDATFDRVARRAPFLTLARRRGVPVYVLHLVASEEEVDRRLARRQTDPAEPSDADLAVYRRARASVEAPEEVPHKALLATTTEGASPEDIVGLLTLRRIAQEPPRRSATPG
jgi:aminoglycoside phosphotransferase family enzyme/predicted kinase